MSSIRSKMFWTFSAVVMGILLLTAILNAGLFKPFSIAQDKRMFRELEKQVRQATSGGVLETDFLAELSATHGVQLDVVDRMTNQIIYSSSNIGLSPGMGKGHSQRYRTSFGRLDLSGESELGFHRLKTTDGEEVLILISPIDHTLALVIYRPIVLIERIVSQSNRFVWLVGLVLLGLGGIIIYWLAGRQVEPILALHRQTDKMASLDFSDRFEARGDDEINRLGQNINAISDKLSQTITTLESDVEKLTEVDRVRKQFVASVSHEFKSPLGIIKGYTEALKYGLVEPQEEAKFFDTIIGETDRMDQLVQDLISLMKRELNHDSVATQPLELCAWLDQMLERHRGLQPDRTYNLDCQMVAVLADPAGLTRVLDNYLQNAYTYGAENSPISIRVVLDEAFARVEVANDGPSIAQDQQQAIWQSFYKIDPARTDRGDGTGLGLPISQALIQSMGGQVGMENTADGVMFFFSLPLAKQDQE